MTVKSDTIRWYLKTAAVILTIGVLSGVGLLFIQETPKGLGHYFIVNTAFFYLLSMGSFIGMAIGMRHRSHSRFLMAYMGAFVAQLVGGAVFFLLAVKLFDVWIDWFFLPFGLCYIAFTILKVSALVRMADAQKSKSS
jgi:hypothetical protein